MDNSNKLTLKRVEHSLSKFNDIAVPHHLDLLRQHKTNILKFEEAGQYTKVQAEQTNAKRVASQLRCLLSEMESLRKQVRSEDLEKFDKITQKSRDLTLRAIMDYLEVIEKACKTFILEAHKRHRINETSPLSINRTTPVIDDPPTLSCSAVSTDSVGMVAHVDGSVDPETEYRIPEVTHLQMQMSNQEINFREREALLAGWSSLQEEVRALHDTWEHMQSAALQQGELVDTTASSVEVATVNVLEGRRNLTMAEKLKVGAYGAGGAAVGALVAGPVGLVIGAKAAAASLVAGSVMGYFGGRLVGKKRKSQLDEETRIEKED